MKDFNPEVLKQLYVSPTNSHKGQNGKLLIIAGSTLFHAASIWPLTVASRMLDMVFYASVPENNEIVQKAKEDFKNGIVVTREKIEDYIKEADCILIGPGLLRTDEPLNPTQDYNLKSLTELSDVEHEGVQTYYLTKYLLTKYKNKKYVIDGGSLQMMEQEWMQGLEHMPILTPHHAEYERLFGNITIIDASRKNNAVILLKGEVDEVVSPTESVKVTGGNAGMTKGGTGDVLAGLVASLYCKNDDPFLVASAASYINKKAGESLEKSMGIYFNASDLVSEIPKVMKDLVQH